MTVEWLRIARQMPYQLHYSTRLFLQTWIKDTHLMASLADIRNKPTPESLTIIDTNKAGDNGVVVALAGQYAIFTMLQTDNYTCNSIFTGRMLFLAPTNNVKALKANDYTYETNSIFCLHCHISI